MQLNPNHISGIYIYCDRWCERCTFTSRCAVFESEQNLSQEENDISNKAFWDNISNAFAQAMIEMKKAAAIHGINLDEVDSVWRRDANTSAEMMRRFCALAFCTAN
jgi:hypothetical protein